MDLAALFLIALGIAAPFAAMTVKPKRRLGVFDDKTLVFRQMRADVTPVQFRGAR